MWVGIIQYIGAQIEQKRQKGKLLPSLPELGQPSLLLLDFRTSGSRAFALPDLYHWLPWFSGLWTRTELYRRLSWFSHLKTVDHGTSQPPQTCEPTPIITLLLYISISLSIYIFRYVDTQIGIYWFCFSGEPRLIQKLVIVKETKTKSWIFGKISRQTLTNS